jgi:hypothetical protein
LEVVVAIDRRAVVSGHNVVLTGFDPRSPLTVGNGEFAFSVDATGLQTFPELHDGPEAIALCTISQWGWHSFPLPEALKGQTLRPKVYDLHGQPLPLHTSHEGQEELFNWLRENPHRLHLGRVGLELVKADGKLAGPGDLRELRAELDLWTGVIRSRFLFEGVPVEVETVGRGEVDGIATRVTSRLVGEGHVRVVVTFPYGSPLPRGADWGQPGRHSTTVMMEGHGRARAERRLDSDAYSVDLRWGEPTTFKQRSEHVLVFEGTADELEISVGFAAVASGGGPSPGGVPPTSPSGGGDARVEVRAARFSAAREASVAFWGAFWNSGGAMDFSDVLDPRAREIERRMVLSQYLLRCNCAGSLPPAETGLTCNSWYGKFHLEMHWWHEVQWAMWGRVGLLERSLGYYAAILPAARALAREQGFAGARWPKMTDPSGRDSPSPVGPLLIWQQPHPIYYAELVYRERPTRETLEKWREIVLESAEFMVDFAKLDPVTGKYVLGPPLKTVSENAPEETTRNSAFELTYWRVGLRWAQTWRERLGLPRDPKADAVLRDLAPLAVDSGRYLLQEGMSDTYTKWNWEHPALVGMRGMLPGDGVDPEVFARTVEKVSEVWKWEETWGWDFPMMAMACARAGRGDLEIKALLVEVPKNRYSAAGHNYQRPNLVTYFPGNGGLLTALAMMAAGWEGEKSGDLPGFPAGWGVKWEGLRKML